MHLSTMLPYELICWWEFILVFSSKSSNWQIYIGGLIYVGVVKVAVATWHVSINCYEFNIGVCLSIASPSTLIPCHKINSYSIIVIVCMYKWTVSWLCFLIWQFYEIDLLEIYTFVIIIILAQAYIVYSFG